MAVHLSADLAARVSRNFRWSTAAAWNNPTTHAALLNAKGEPYGGKVVCCNGQQYMCSFAKFLPSTQGLDPAILAIIDRCIREHERTHRGDVQPCPDAGVSVPGWNDKLAGDKAGQGAQEVIGAQAEFDCLQRYRDGGACKYAADPAHCDQWLDSRQQEMHKSAAENGGIIKP